MGEVAQAIPQVRPAQRSPRVLRNVVSNWGSYAFSLAVNFFVAPYVVRHLGDSAYGVWTLMVSLTGYLGLMDLGVRGAVTRYVAKFHAQTEHDKSGKVASSALLVFTAAGVLTILVSSALAFFVVGHFRIPPQYQTAARMVLVIAGMDVAMSLVSGVFGGILVGLQRFDLANLLGVSFTGLRAVAVVVALHAGRGLVTLALIQLACSLSRLVAYAIVSRRLYPELHLRPGSAEWSYLQLIFSFSAFSFMIHVSATLIYYSDSVVIGAFLPVGLITFFAIGGSLVEYSRTLISGISQTMSPLASSLEAQQKDNELQRVLLNAVRFSTTAILPITLTFMLRGSTFIGLWMGPRYADLSGRVLWVLALPTLFAAADQTACGIVLGISKHKPVVPVIIAEGLCNLALSIAWVRTMGVLGVAWGTAVPSLVSNLLFWPWYLRRALKVPISTYVKTAWILPMIAISPFAICSYVIERFWSAANLVVFFSQVALVLPLAAVGYWYVCFDAENRQALRQKLRRAAVHLGHAAGAKVMGGTNSST